ncbi:MAG: divalent cation tolerance protein CutA [Sphingomonadales bacterium]|nr:divalent cation tolerance protein CutA [Sphingomonadales bacterium]
MEGGDLAALLQGSPVQGAAGSRVEGSDPRATEPLHSRALPLDDALRIAHALLGEGLIACANILDGMTSVYRWDGEIREDREAVLILKSRTELTDRVTARVRELHSYDCPCVVWWPVASGNPASPWPLKFIFDNILIPQVNTTSASVSVTGGLDPLVLLTLLCLAIVAIAALQASAAYLSTFGMALAVTQILAEVRAILFSHLQRLSLAFHHKAKTGDLISRVTSDIERLPFPMAPVGAQGILALSEEQEESSRKNTTARRPAAP